MNSHHIESLLNKFWEAETSLEEELLLKSYFNGDDIDASLAYAAPFFWSNKTNKGNTKDIAHVIVKKLLDKYYRAETSLEEELILKEYFLQKSEIPELKADSALFSTFAKAGNLEYHKPLHRKDTLRKSARILNVTWLKSVAAAIILLIGAYFIVKINTPTNEDQGFAKATVIEPEDPEVALAYTLKALAMLSDKYKKGEDQLIHGMRTMNDAKNPNN